MTTTDRTDSVTTQLDRDWQHLRRRPAALRRARSWASHEAGGALARHAGSVEDLQTLLDRHAGSVEDLQTLLDRHAGSVEDLQTLLDRSRGRGTSDGEADALLLSLVAVAQDDQLAGRVVIQRILPGLISRAAHYHNRRDPFDPVDLAVAAAWIALRRYDWRRRDRHVAASLISDTTYQAFRRPLRRMTSREQIHPPDMFSLLPAPVGSALPVDELAEVLADAGGAGVPSSDLDLLDRLARDGSTRPLAREQDVTTRTIRNRRGRAISKVREALVDAA